MKKGPAPPAAKTTSAPAKQPEKKVWRAEDYVTLILPIEQVKDIKTAFDVFDSDSSGTVDPKQLKHAFQQLGFEGNNKFVYQILAELDDDNSGGIDFAQFLRLATAKIEDKSSRADTDKIWQSFDVNRSGKITSLELKRVAENLGEDLSEEQINEIFRKADLDDDGFVTGDDFYNIMTHKVYWDK